MYRLIISEKARDPYGRALEILGSYNPYTKKLQAKKEKIKYWLSKGAGMSPAVNNLLIENNIIKGEKIKASRTRKKKSSSAPPFAKGGATDDKKTAKEEGQKYEKAEEKPDKTEKEKIVKEKEKIKKTEEKPEESSKADKAKEETKTENTAEKTEKEEKETSKK